MTSLLASVREDAEVVKARKDVEDSVSAVDVCGSGDAWQGFFEDRDAYDTALLRAAVREIAKRLKATAQSYVSDGHPEIACEWLNAADFIEGSLE